MPPKGRGQKATTPMSSSTGVLTRDVLEGGEGGEGGGLKGGGVVGRDPPLLGSPLWSGGPKNCKLKSSWRQSKILLPSAKHLEEGGGTTILELPRL